MEKIKLSSLNWAKMKLFNRNDEYRNSDLYVYEDKLYKLYKINNFGIKCVLDCLEMNKNLSKCVYPNKYIYLNDEFIGYEMNFYPNHKSLESTLEDDIEISLKKTLSKYIIMELKYIHKNGFAHTDFHLGNIITDKKDIFYIDIDSFLPKILSTTEIFNHELFMDIVCSSRTILSYIYGIDFNILNQIELIDIIEHELSLKKEIKEYLLATINQDNSINNLYIDSFIDNMEDDKIDFDKRRVLAKYL